MHGNAIFRVAFSIRKPLEAVIPHDVDSIVGAPELINRSLDNQDGAIYDVALSRHEHAADRQEPVAVDIHPVRCRRF